MEVETNERGNLTFPPPCQGDRCVEHMHTNQMAVIRPE